MTLLKFGAMVTEGSGSLGGHTIQHSKGGMQLRTKPLPGGKATPSQTLIRSINPVLQAGWRALTDAQRKIWNDWPAIHGIMNAHGDHRPLSGHSLWMKYNFSWLYAGGTFLPDPSYWPSPILGTEIMLNGTFENSSHWSFNTPPVTISSGKFNYDATISGSSAYGDISPNIIAGNFYHVSFDVFTNICWLRFYSGGDIFPWLTWPVGNNEFNSVAAFNVSNYIRFLFYWNNGPLSIDNLSIKKIYS